MPYRFKLEEKFDSGFRRIVREQVKQAEAELSATSAPASAIHETRKAIKRLRALLKTAAPTLGAKAARKHDRVFRDIARALSSRRDDDVIEATVASLESRYGADAVAILAPLRSALDNAKATVAPALDAARAQELREALKTEGKKLRKLRLKGFGLSAVVEGTGASYAAGRRALKRAIKQPSDERIHDLRKTVQAHWRHMALLSRAWPEEFAARVMVSRELSQVLGDDHDLVLVKTAASQLAGDETTAASAKAIIELCERRQANLRDAMKPHAARLYAESPQAFMDRLTVYVQTARRNQEPVKKVSVQPAPDKAIEKTADKANGAAPHETGAGSSPTIAAKTPG
ncbi:MAG: CHAD domain-containing protein [Hyphomicrobium sp.]|nr:CHAD domain-containing protein [Hyphomicrobium sp.]